MASRDFSQSRREWRPSNQEKRSGRKSSRKVSKRSPLVRSLLLFFASLLLIAMAAVAVGGAWFINELVETLPTDQEILSYRANEASVVYDRKNRVIAELFLENRRPVQLPDVSRWMVMSILAAEDSAFYTHHGIRFLAILRSLASGDGGSGASTITQQLARNLFLSSEKTLIRKAKEAILSLRIEKLYSKDKILETYLNAIYFGHGSWGIDSASRSYFAKPAKTLSLAEASTLAGLVASPERYSPIRNPELSKRRQGYVLRRLVQLGWISQEEADSAAAEKLVLNQQTVNNQFRLTQAPYFVSHILFKELLPVYGSDRVYKGGMRIMTTLDLDLQKAAERAMAELKSEGALVAMDPESGEVLALVGGKNFDQSKFNRATQAYRQPGSAFKPIVYMTALEAGYLPNDHIMDREITLRVPNSPTPIWSPQNFSQRYAGEETLLEALNHSHNTPVVRLTCLLGVSPIIDMARRLGVTSPHLKPALSIGLGVASVTPLEMATVYSVFANGGAKVTPSFVREIRSNEGTVLFSATQSQTSAVESQYALIGRSMLMDVVRTGTGRRARIPGYEVFGKTGSTNDHSDAWFAGGVPGLVTVLYAGNDNYATLGNRATGAVVALPVWTAFMKEAVEILGTPTQFPALPPSLVETQICLKSGYPAVASCETSTVALPQDRLPSQSCPLHDTSDSSSVADANAPRLLLLLPQDEEWMPHQQAPQQLPLPVLPVLPEIQPPAPMEDIPVELPRPNQELSLNERYEALLRHYNLRPPAPEEDTSQDNLPEP